MKSELINFSAYTSGLILFCIGLIGLTDAHITPSPTVTMLLEPLGYGEKTDMFYYWCFIVLGGWLVVHIGTRLAAMIALTMVIYKLLILQGYLALIA